MQFANFGSFVFAVWISVVMDWVVNTVDLWSLIDERDCVRAYRLILEAQHCPQMLHGKAVFACGGGGIFLQTYFSLPVLHSNGLEHCNWFRTSGSPLWPVRGHALEILRSDVALLQVGLQDFFTAFLPACWRSGLLAAAGCRRWFQGGGHRPFVPDVWPI